MEEIKIKYFKRLKKNKPILNRNRYPMEKYFPVGCSLNEIKQLEQEKQIHFPKAYVEFLYLAGKSHQLFDAGIDSEYEILGEIQEAFEEELKTENIEMNRPVWAIDMLDGEQFAFFYLDENLENPIIYRYLNENDDFNLNKEVFYSTKNTLSQYVETLVPTKAEKIISQLISAFTELVTLKFLNKK